jgi:hypothetical protein
LQVAEVVRMRSRRGRRSQGLMLIRESSVGGVSVRSVRSSWLQTLAHVWLRQCLEKESRRQARSRSHTNSRFWPGCRKESHPNRRIHGRSARSRPSGHSKSPKEGLATTRCCERMVLDVG